jgi:Rrf2 family protein
MLSLSKKTDYALLALSYLARLEGTRAANTREIAEQFDIPVEMLAKILQTLAKSRLITSTSGPTGGYRLARPATEITVAAAIEAIDGPPAIAQCLKPDGNRCEQIGKCTIRKPLTRINMRILQMLSLISLAEISSDEAESRSEETAGYPILKLSRRHAPEPVSIL